LTSHNISCTEEKAEKIVALLKERVVFSKDFWTEGKFFFVAPEMYDENVISQKWTSEAVNVISEFKNNLRSEKEVNSESAKTILNAVLDKHQVKIGKVLQALRVAITGVGAGPDLMNIIELLGSDETCKRMENALEVLS